MATTTIPWGDGSGDNLYFTADSMSGNQNVQVSSDPNTGDTDRTKNVNFQASGVSPQPLQIIQLRGGGGGNFDDWVKDGDTHLWINILNDYQKAQEIRIRMIGTIDWGDGSTPDSVSVTTYTTFTHTYADKGKYRIDLHPTSGTFYLGGNSTSYSVMGSRTTNTTYRYSVLYQAEIGSSIIDTITQYAFYYCYGLRKIYIPKNVTSAGQQVFSFCYSLTSLEFEDATKLTTGGASFFYNCVCLQDLGGLSPSWGTALNSIIRNCHNITEFIIPSNVTNIAANSFGNTYSLQKLWVYPSSPPTVANANAFTNINSSCVIYVPNGKLTAYQTASIWSTYASQMVEMPATP